MSDSTVQPQASALAGKWGLPGSQRLVRILQTILADSEMRLLLNMPFSIAQPSKVGKIVEGLGIDEQSARAMLEDLYQRGIVAIGEYEGEEPLWYVPSLGILMDSTHWDPRYDQYGAEYYDLWRDFVNEEILPITKNPEEVGFHIIPIDEPIPIEGTRQVLDHETAQSLIRNSSRIVVLACPCRTRERKCDAPMEACIALNEFAGYFHSRKMGREINRDEALSILADCEEKGLVHQVPTGEHPDVICNCCTCCCIVLRSFQVTNKSYLVGSGFHPQWDEEKCSFCLTCMDACPFEAISEHEGKPVLFLERCLGCGQCVRVCPERALSLIEGETPPRTKRQDTLGERFQWSHISRG